HSGRHRQGQTGRDHGSWRVAVARRRGQDRAGTVKTVAVLGAGIMGRGIAYASALAGYENPLQDVSQSALDHARADNHGLLDKGVAAGKVDAHASAGAKARLKTIAKLDEAVPAADLVIEAVPEDMRLKLDLFGALDRMTPPSALLASNTSS